MSYIQTSRIRMDGGTQSRAELNTATVEEYRQLIDDYRRENKDTVANGGWPFRDPVVVFYDGKEYWLGDGYHRVTACIQAGRFEVVADIRQGTQRDAMLHAAGANAAHGLPRTADDKRRAVLLLLNDPEWGQWSNMEIARRCNVSESFVRSVKKDAGHTSFETKYLHPKTGKETVMKKASKTVTAVEAGPDATEPQLTWVNVNGSARLFKGDVDVTPARVYSPTYDPESGKVTYWRETERAPEPAPPAPAFEPKPMDMRTFDQVAYEWLRDYVDDKGRTWRNLTDNQTWHGSSPCWQSFTKAYPDIPKDHLKAAREQLVYEEVIEQANEDAMLRLIEDDTDQPPAPALPRRRSGFPAICPEGRNPVCGANCHGCQFYFRTPKSTWECHHADYQNEPGDWWCTGCGVELMPNDTRLGYKFCRVCAPKGYTPTPPAIPNQATYATCVQAVIASIWELNTQEATDCATFARNMGIDEPSHIQELWENVGKMIRYWSTIPGRETKTASVQAGG